MANILSIYNQAGGVGKTTVTMNVGYHLALKKKRVLLVDLDPQGSLTAFMGISPDALDVKDTLLPSLIDQSPLPIRKTDYLVSLVSANISFSSAGNELLNAPAADRRLAMVLEDVASDFDYILLDSPPSVGPLSLNSLVAATHLLLPIQTEYKALEGTRTIISSIAKVKQIANRNMQIAGIVPTMYKKGELQSDTSLGTIGQVAESLNCPLFTPIPRRTDFANASQFHQPLAAYSPKNDAVAVLNKIARELIKRYG